MNPLKIILAGAAATTLIALAPAVVTAQPMDAPAVRHDWKSIHDRAEWLRSRVDQGQIDGSISGEEARRVREEIDNITSDDARLRASGAGELGVTDRVDLQRRLDAVADQIHWLRQTTLQRPW